MRKVRCFLEKLVTSGHAWIVVGIVATVIVLGRYDIQQVSGSSMYPAFYDKDYILVEQNGAYKNHDVIVLDVEEQREFSGEHIIKRYYEEYSTDGLFVMGDNAEISFDSRYVGELDADTYESVVRFNITKFFRDLKENIQNS